MRQYFYYFIVYHCLGYIAQTKRQKIDGQGKEDKM